MKNLTSLTLLIFCLLASGFAYSFPKLNSYPTATATIYIDFDGHSVIGSSWNNGNPIFCSASGFNDTQITEIFNRVSEDYRPFNVNITTDSTKFLLAPLDKRIRIIVTPTSSWTNGVGGLSYIGSFTWGDDTPCFVFSDRLNNYPKYVAECCSHESGHAVGLSHQSAYDNNCNLIETYNQGSGTGQISWSPIMGNSYHRNMTGWYNGPTPYGCNNTQDNLTIITAMNGFTYRTDDYSDARNNSTYALGTSFQTNGLITTSDDQDAFKYSTTQTVNFHLDAVPFSIGADNNGANLDIKISLYKGATLIRTYDPIGIMHASIDTVLNSGTYYIVVDGTGNNNATNYSSLGSYTITGFNGPLPIHEVVLTGRADKYTHHLNWQIKADEPIKSIDVEVSTDGRSFEILSPAIIGAGQFQTNYSDIHTRYYRLKVISVLDQIAYSNTIALKTAELNQSFQVSTLVSTSIRIQANDRFSYQLLDINGRIHTSGTGFSGTNQLDVSSKSAGMYILRIIKPDNTTQTERIIKQ